MDIATSYLRTCTVGELVAGYTHTPFITNKLLIAGPNLMLRYFSLSRIPCGKFLPTISSNGLGWKQRTKLRREQIQLSGKVFADTGAARFVIPNPDTVQSAQFVHKC